MDKQGRRRFFISGDAERGRTNKRTLPCNLIMEPLGVHRRHFVVEMKDAIVLGLGLLERQPMLGN